MALNAYRQGLVDFLFLLLDQNGSGFIELIELTAYFDKIPTTGILGTGNRKIPGEQKAREVIQILGNEMNSHISLSDMTKYYTDKCANYPDDYSFKYELIDDWQFEEEMADMYLVQVTSAAGSGGGDPNSSVKVRRKSGDNILNGGTQRRKSLNSNCNSSSSNDSSRRSSGEAFQSDFDFSMPPAADSGIFTTNSTANEPHPPSGAADRRNQGSGTPRSPRVTTASISQRWQTTPLPPSFALDKFNQTIEERTKIYEDIYSDVSTRYDMMVIDEDPYEDVADLPAPALGGLTRAASRKMLAASASRKEIIEQVIVEHAHLDAVKEEEVRRLSSIIDAMETEMKEADKKLVMKDKLLKDQQDMISSQQSLVMQQMEIINMLMASVANQQQMMQQHAQEHAQQILALQQHAQQFQQQHSSPQLPSPHQQQQQQQQQLQSLPGPIARVTINAVQQNAQTVLQHQQQVQQQQIQQMQQLQMQIQNNIGPMQIRNIGPMSMQNIGPMPIQNIGPMPIQNNIGPPMPNILNIGNISNSNNNSMIPSAIAYPSGSATATAGGAAGAATAGAFSQSTGVGGTSGTMTKLPQLPQAAQQQQQPR